MLKIAQARNAYDELGLPRSATPVQIRMRYRQLARKFRRELPVEELFKDERFRGWTNAFLVLTGPGRREYDRRLRETRGREASPDLLSQLSETQRMLLEAEVAFIQRKLNDAIELAKAALKKDKTNADGYALVGDILREQGKYEQALSMYNYAIQFDPDNRRYWQLMQEATALQEGKALPKRYRREMANVLNRPPSVWVGVGLAIIFVSLSMVWLETRMAKTVFLFSLPHNLIYLALFDGFILGLVLAGTAVLQPFDDEMIGYQVAAIGTQTTPVGVLVALPGIVFFWAAPVFYAIVALLDEHLSTSITISLFLCSLLALGFGYMAPESARIAAYVFSGNFALLGFLFGWMLGSLRRRIFEH